MGNDSRSMIIGPPRGCVYRPASSRLECCSTRAASAAAMPVNSSKAPGLAHSHGAALPSANGSSPTPRAASSNSSPDRKVDDLRHPHGGLQQRRRSAACRAACPCRWAWRGSGQWRRAWPTEPPLSAMCVPAAVRQQHGVQTPPPGRVARASVGVSDTRNSPAPSAPERHSRRHRPRRRRPTPAPTQYHAPEVGLGERPAAKTSRAQPQPVGVVADRRRPSPPRPLCSPRPHCRRRRAIARPAAAASPPACTGR